MVEAMACGTPVVASTASCLPEVAGDAALLAPPTDVAALAAALDQAAHDEATRARLIEAGFRRARLFTWADSAQKHLEIYRRLSHAGPPGE